MVFGQVLYLKLVTMSEPDFDGMRSCVFEVNGDSRTVQVRDEAVGADTSAREVADPLAEGSVGAPMPGVVVEVTVDVGDDVIKVSFLLFTVTFYANLAHSLTRSP